ncbi:hypothetical protein, partial [Rubneribacter badeniensis]|uniref:hypothetical protein n=1 Tax=Rubneribacter badeniensis TaxID=2070688 RepID=UPI003A91DC65
MRNLTPQPFVLETFDWGCGQKVGHSGVRIGVRMYPLETRELAVEAVAAGFSLTEAAELAG